MTSPAWHRYTAAGPLTALTVNPTNELAVVGGRDVLRVLLLNDDGFRETLNLHVPEGGKLSPFAPTDIKWSSPSAGNLVATAARGWYFQTGTHWSPPGQPAHGASASPRCR